MSQKGCLLALLLVGAIAAAQNTATIDPNLNQKEDAYMTRQAAALLDSVRGTLRDHPPKYPEPEQRRLALLVLDGVLHDKYAAFRKPVQDYFRFAIQSAMSDLRDGPPVMDGAMIYKLYNMAYIVKTPSATIAFDLTRGGSAKAPGFTLPDDLMKQIADQCDALFISHRHGDHTDKVVAQMFIDAGRPVVAPPQVWDDEPIGQAITRLKREAHTLQTLPIKGGKAELKVVVYPGHQMRETENNVTLVFTPDGLSFCHLGDQINEGDFMDDYAWIDEVAKHHRVDVFMPNCWTNELYRIVQGIDPKLVLPGHQNELGHTIDDRVPYWGDETFLNLTNRQLRESSYPVIVMTWGEWFHYVPAKEEKDDDASAPPDQAALDTYRQFLDTLPKDQPISVSRAIDEYLIKIVPLNISTRDHALLLFFDFHMQLCLAMDKKIRAFIKSKEAPNGHDYLYRRFWREYPATDEYREMQRNGLEYRHDEEGRPDTRAVPSYIPEVFRRHVSPSLQSFLALRQKELEEGFAGDAELSVEFDRLAERTGQWEEYLKQFPKSLVRADAGALRDECLDAMIGSCENSTPDIYPGGPDIKGIYSRYADKYRDTESGKVIAFFSNEYDEYNWKYSYEIRNASRDYWRGFRTSNGKPYLAWPAIQLYYRVFFLDGKIPKGTD